jgi:hypothetical protein
MNMMEEQEGMLKGWKVEILATDLNDRSARSCQGWYLRRLRSAFNPGLFQAQVLLRR